MRNSQEICRWLHEKFTGSSHLVYQCQKSRPRSLYPETVTRSTCLKLLDPPWFTASTCFATSARQASSSFFTALSTSFAALPGYTSFFVFPQGSQIMDRGFLNGCNSGFFDTSCVYGLADWKLLWHSLHGLATVDMIAQTSAVSTSFYRQSELDINWIKQSMLVSGRPTHTHWPKKGRLLPPCTPTAPCDRYYANISSKYKQVKMKTKNKSKWKSKILPHKTLNQNFREIWKSKKRRQRFMYRIFGDAKRSLKITCWWV